jgi:hypothetical protein
MPSNGLIVIAPVKPGADARLRATLNAIGHDVKGKRLKVGVLEPHIDFLASRTIHFARMALLDDPNVGPGRARLLLVTDYDGSWGDHVKDLFRITAQPEEIWGCCEGYTDGDRFPVFIRRYTVRPQAYYIAFRGVTLEHIRSALAARAKSTAPQLNLPPGSLTASILAIFGDLLRFPFAFLDVPGILWRRGPVNTLLAARRINATLDRVWWARLFNLVTLNQYPPPPHRYSSAPVDTAAGCAPATPEDEVTREADRDQAPAEDAVAQNQLTLLTVVRPDQLPRLRAVLDLIELYARRLTEQGSLVGISTIHTVRWALIDGGERLLFASNYDGTWEAYIDEFAELILSGLDALWEGSYGFPELGAKDLAALKHFLRCHQVPANVFYSAYPAATVPNISDALRMENTDA